MKEYIQVEDVDEQDCEACDLNPIKDSCQYPYCERNKIIFKKLTK